MNFHFGIIYSFLEHRYCQTFWNNLFFSGTPLLPDPQAPIFYLPNIIFLFIKSVDLGFELSIFIHIFAGGIGMYLLSKSGFKFTKNSSLFCAFIYIASPKLSGFIEAGHFGLITSWAWLPFVFLATILLSQSDKVPLSKTFKKSIFLGVTLAGIFFTHVLIFIIAVIALSFLYIFLKGNIKYLVISGIFCFGLIAIAFLPQLSWQGSSTRNLLLNDPDVYPKWQGFTDFFKAAVSPILFGPKFIWNLDTEKTIGLGLSTCILAFFGFLKLKFKNKILISIVLLAIILISLNNISPIYSLLIKQNWYILLRVSTRFWFLVVFIFIYLTGLGFDYLIKRRNTKIFIYIIAFIAILELLLTSWTRILKPIPVDSNLAPQEVYDFLSQSDKGFLSQDKDQFRVFCLNRCLSQKKSAIYGLELAEGYGTLQQKNYYDYSEQLSQAFYRNRYTLSIPPFEIFEYESLQPYSPNLAAFNIKYIVSNHLLKDINLIFVRKIDNYLIYKNDINRERSNYPITFYSPNFIQIDTQKYKDTNVVLSEVYNPDWEAFINGTKRTKVEETLDKTRQVDIDTSTKFVNFIYRPMSFKVGLLITTTTLFSIFCFFLVKKR